MFVLAHLTDPHLGPLPAVRKRDLASKQLVGYLNWQRNRTHAFDLDILSALTEDIRAHHPDHIAVTGDLVNLALADEVTAALDWLASLGTPENVTVIPGNHDAYVPGAFAEVSRAWQPFMADDERADEVAHFPFVRRRPPAALIGLSSAVPTAPFMATGRIGPEQTAPLGKMLAALGEEGLFRIVLIHHPPLTGVYAWPRRLIGASLFRAQIARHGAELILHGHNHRTHVTTISGANQAVPVVGAAAASNTPRPYRAGGSYNLYRLDGRAGAFTCSMIERGVRDAGGRVETLSERVLLSG